MKSGIPNRDYISKALRLYIDIHEITDSENKEIAYRHLKACKAIIEYVNGFDVNQIIWAYNNAKKIIEIFPIVQFYMLRTECLQNLTSVIGFKGNYLERINIENEFLDIYNLYEANMSPEFLFLIDGAVNSIVQAIGNSSLIKTVKQQKIQFHINKLKSYYSPDSLSSSFTIIFLSWTTEREGIEIDY